MRNGKATEPDLIPVDVWKAMGEGVDILYDLIVKILKQNIYRKSGVKVY